MSAARLPATARCLLPPAVRLGAVRLAPRWFGAAAAREAGSDSPAVRLNIGVGPGAQGLTMAEWSRKKNAVKGPPVTAGFQDWSADSEVRITARRVPGVPLYMPALFLEGVLTERECEGLIAAVPAGGPGHLGREEVYQMYHDRVVKYRYMTNDVDLAVLLQGRLRDYIPSELDGGRLLGVNPGFRFVHHDQGGHQAGHIDGREPVGVEYNEVAGGWVQSRLSLQIYLNGGYRGGEFAILEPDPEKPGGHRPRFVLQPKAGDAILFYQERFTPNSSYELFHEARDVLEGDKFACRTVVDYVFPDKERARRSNLKDDLP